MDVIHSQTREDAHIHTGTQPPPEMETKRHILAWVDVGTMLNTNIGFFALENLNRQTHKTFVFFFWREG